MFYDKVTLEAEQSAFQASVDAVQAINLAVAPVVATSEQSTRTAFRRAMGTWFDEGVDLREPEGDAFTRYVIDLIVPFEGLKIRRSKAKEENHYARIRKLIANALRCFYYFDPELVAFQRKGGRFKNKPEWFTGSGMRVASDALAKAGLIDLIPGERGTASTYEATKALLLAAFDFGITEASLVYRLPRERLVRLYETNREGPYLDFDQTDETGKWANTLETVNGFLDQQDIALPLSREEQWKIVEGVNYKRKKDMPRYVATELTRRHLYRQFNNGSFDEGGRLYGVWWQGIPEYLRSRITINGQPTVELDYSGCAIRMLYHLRGKECPDDPYHLADIVAYEMEKGYPVEHFREAIKDLTLARINGSNRDKDMMCNLTGGVTFSPRFTRNQVTAMIEAKHEAIADAFGSGAGIRLQRMDSDLALAIVRGLMDKGIVALPIHDSFIVEASYKEQLFDEMNNQYKVMFGYNPVIKMKGQEEVLFKSLI